MSSLNNPSATPGWYPDPEAQGVLRYWNGATWEEWRQPAVAAPTVQAPTNGIAVTSLVFSLVGIALDLTFLLGILGFGCSIVGILCGRKALGRSATLGRRGMARWGFWLGLGAAVLQVALVILFLVLSGRLGRGLSS